MEQLPDDAIEVGKIVDAYGIKGAIKLHPFSNTADGLLHVKTWWLKKTNNTVQSVSVDIAKRHGISITAQLMGFIDRNQAEALKNTSVWVSKSMLPTTQTDEYYWTDLIGCQALAIDGSVLGVIVDLTDTGVHSVLHIDCGETIDTVLIPFVNEYVGVVDLKAKTVETQWQRDWLESKS